MLIEKPNDLLSLASVVLPALSGSKWWTSRRASSVAGAPTHEEAHRRADAA